MSGWPARTGLLMALCVVLGAELLAAVLVANGVCR